MQILIFSNDKILTFTPFSRLSIIVMQVVLSHARQVHGLAQRVRAKRASDPDLSVLDPLRGPRTKVEPLTKELHQSQRTLQG